MFPHRDHSIPPPGLLCSPRGYYFPLLIFRLENQCFQQDIARVFNQDERTKKKTTKKQVIPKQKKKPLTEIRTKTKRGFKTNYKIDKTDKNDPNKREKRVNKLH